MIELGLIAHIYLHTIILGSSVEMEKYKYFATIQGCTTYTQSFPDAQTRCLPMAKQPSDTEALAEIKQALRSHQETKARFSCPSWQNS